MKRYIVKRPKDTVEVLILPNKNGSGYQYVNLTKGHICPCKFKTELEALRDMDKKVSEDKILYYEENEEIKESRDCWKGCLYASGKSELILEYLQQKYNLIKAKELLAKWVELFKPKGGNIPPTPIQVDTEQFLSEVEK